MKKILITGAAGQIGRALRQAWQGKYRLRLSDIAPLAPTNAHEECVPAELSDLAAVERLMPGIEAVAHFGGQANEASWDDLLGPNIIGVYNVLEGARRHGVKRVVLASSNHAIGFYRRTQTLDPTRIPRPDGLYGVTKAFCEAIGSLYADKYGLTVACLRIGTFKHPDRPESPRHLSTWISHRDLVQLVERCIEAPDYHFAIAYGMSANTRALWDNALAAPLGYRPQDNAEQYAAEIAASGLVEDAVAALFHGGPFVPPGLAVDPARIP